MLHPRLTPVGGTIGGSTSQWLAQIGPTGAWGDLAFTTRWGDGACGMYEASWTMPLPPKFEHPLLRRGTLVELMDGPWRVGSPLIMNEPAIGTDVDAPWQITCSGIGREVEGTNSFLAFDGSFNSIAVPSTAVDQAISRGWRIGGRATSVPTTQIGGNATTTELNTVAALLNSAADSLNQRWGVGQDNILAFYSDPTSPTWQVTPTSPSLGTADDDYASSVFVRYVLASGAYATWTSTNSQYATQYGVREYPVDLTNLGALTAGQAQGFADAILAKVKARLNWTNGLTLTSNELLTMGGVPAALSMVEAGQMLRIHGIFNDLLDYNGQTWLDIIIGEAKYFDGAQTIDINPLGMAARDFAAVIGEVTGLRDEAA